MRRALPAAVLPLLALGIGCGEDPAPARPEPRVEVAVTAPADAAVVRERTVALEGTVTPPAAAVAVRGEEVAVEGGRFRAEVELAPGANLIDVTATAPDRRPGFASARVVLEERVTVPDLVGETVDGAVERLEALGLEVATEDGGGFFEPLLPGDPKVCSAQPGGGAQVLPGAEVLLVVARDC